MNDYHVPGFTMLGPLGKTVNKMQSLLLKELVVVWQMQSEGVYAANWSVKSS